MGGVGDAISNVASSFDPTSSSFNPIRAATDVGTFGTAELANAATGGSIFNNKRPLGLGPLGDIGLTAAGAYLGGPIGGALAGGLTGGLGGALGGGLGGGLLGGGLGALGGLGGALGGGLGGLGGMLGGSLLGLGLSKDTSIPDVQFPSAAGDIGAIHSEEDRLKQMQGQSQTDLLNMLTTGPQGEAFREKYNNLGLLDSGAFNAGLAEQFANQNYAQNQQLQNLDVSGLSRQFGLEDVGTQYNIAKALQDARQKAAEQQSLIGSGAYLLGGGGAGMGLGSGGGAGGGGLPGILGGLGGGLSNIFGNIGSGLSNLFGGGGLDTSMNPTTGNPLLDLYPTGNPFGASMPSSGFLPGPVPGGFAQPLSLGF